MKKDTASPIGSAVLRLLVEAHPICQVILDGCWFLPFIKETPVSQHIQICGLKRTPFDPPALFLLTAYQGWDRDLVSADLGICSISLML